MNKNQRLEMHRAELAEDRRVAKIRREFWAAVGALHEAAARPGDDNLRRVLEADPQLRDWRVVRVLNDDEDGVDIVQGHGEDLQSWHVDRRALRDELGPNHAALALIDVLVARLREQAWAARIAMPIAERGKRSASTRCKVKAAPVFDGVLKWLCAHPAAKTMAAQAAGMDADKVPYTPATLKRARVRARKVSS